MNATVSYYDLYEPSTVMTEYLSEKLLKFGMRKVFTSKHFRILYDNSQAENHFLRIDLLVRQLDSYSSNDQAVEQTRHLDST